MTSVVDLSVNWIWIRVIPFVGMGFKESMMGAGRVVGLGRGELDVFVDVLDVDLVDILVEDVLVEDVLDVTFDDVTFDDVLDEVLVEEVLDEEVTDTTVSLNTARMAY